MAEYEVTFESTVTVSAGSKADAELYAWDQVEAEMVVASVVCVQEDEDDG